MGTKRAFPLPIRAKRLFPKVSTDLEGAPETSNYDETTHTSFMDSISLSQNQAASNPEELVSWIDNLSVRVKKTLGDQAQQARLLKHAKAEDALRLKLSTTVYEDSFNKLGSLLQREQNTTRDQEESLSQLYIEEGQQTPLVYGHDDSPYPEEEPEENYESRLDEHPALQDDDIVEILSSEDEDPPVASKRPQLLDSYRHALNQYQYDEDEEGEEDDENIYGSNEYLEIEDADSYDNQDQEHDHTCHEIAGHEVINESEEVDPEEYSDQEDEESGGLAMEESYGAYDSHIKSPRVPYQRGSEALSDVNHLQSEHYSLHSGPRRPEDVYPNAQPAFEEQPSGTEEDKSIAPADDEVILLSSEDEDDGMQGEHDNGEYDNGEYDNGEYEYDEEDDEEGDENEYQSDAYVTHKQARNIEEEALVHDEFDPELALSQLMANNPDPNLEEHDEESLSRQMMEAVLLAQQRIDEQEYDEDDVDVVEEEGDASSDALDPELGDLETRTSPLAANQESGIYGNQDLLILAEAVLESAKQENDEVDQTAFETANNTMEEAYETRKHSHEVQEGKKFHTDVLRAGYAADYESVDSGLNDDYTQIEEQESSPAAVPEHSHENFTMTSPSQGLPEIVDALVNLSEGSLADVEENEPVKDDLEEQENKNDEVAEERPFVPQITSNPIFKTVEEEDPEVVLSKLKETENKFHIKLNAVQELEEKIRSIRSSPTVLQMDSKVDDIVDESKDENYYQDAVGGDLHSDPMSAFNFVQKEASKSNESRAEKSIIIETETSEQEKTADEELQEREMEVSLGSLQEKQAFIDMDEEIQDVVEDHPMLEQEEQEISMMDHDNVPLRDLDREIEVSDEKAHPIEVLSNPIEDILEDVVHVDSESQDDLEAHEVLSHVSEVYDNGQPQRPDFLPATNESVSGSSPILHSKESPEGRPFGEPEEGVVSSKPVNEKTIPAALEHIPVPQLAQVDEDSQVSSAELEKQEGGHGDEHSHVGAQNKEPHTHADVDEKSVFRKEIIVNEPADPADYLILEYDKSAIIEVLDEDIIRTTEILEPIEEVATQRNNILEFEDNQYVNNLTTDFDSTEGGLLRPSNIIEPQFRDHFNAVEMEGDLSQAETEIPVLPTSIIEAVSNRVTPEVCESFQGDAGTVMTVVEFEEDKVTGSQKVENFENDLLSHKDSTISDDLSDAPVNEDDASANEFARTQSLDGKKKQFLVDTYSSFDLGLNSKEPQLTSVDDDKSEEVIQEAEEIKVVKKVRDVNVSGEGTDELLKDVAETSTADNEVVLESKHTEAYLGLGNTDTSRKRSIENEEDVEQAPLKKASGIMRFLNPFSYFRKSLIPAATGLDVSATTPFEATEEIIAEHSENNNQAKVPVTDIEIQLLNFEAAADDISEGKFGEDEKDIEEDSDREADPEISGYLKLEHQDEIAPDEIIEPLQADPQGEHVTVFQGSEGVKSDVVIVEDVDATEKGITSTQEVNAVPVVIESSSELTDLGSEYELEEMLDIIEVENEKLLENTEDFVKSQDRESFSSTKDDDTNPLESGNDTSENPAEGEIVETTEQQPKTTKMPRQKNEVTEETVANLPGQEQEVPKSSDRENQITVLPDYNEAEEIDRKNEEEVSELRKKGKEAHKKAQSEILLKLLLNEKNGRSSSGKRTSLKYGNEVHFDNVVEENVRTLEDETNVDFKPAGIEVFPNAQNKHEIAQTRILNALKNLAKEESQHNTIDELVPDSDDISNRSETVLDLELERKEEQENMMKEIGEEEKEVGDEEEEGRKEGVEDVEEENKPEEKDFRSENTPNDDADLGAVLQLELSQAVANELPHNMEGIGAEEIVPAKVDESAKTDSTGVEGKSETTTAAVASELEDVPLYLQPARTRSHHPKLFQGIEKVEKPSRKRGRPQQEKVERSPSKKAASYAPLNLVEINKQRVSSGGELSPISPVLSPNQSEAVSRTVSEGGSYVDVPAWRTRSKSPLKQSLKEIISPTDEEPAHKRRRRAKKEELSEHDEAPRGRTRSRRS